MSRTLVWGVVMCGGYLALAAEISLARLLRPWLGDWLGVWAAVIGFVLLYLALGNWLGGRWSRRGDGTRMGWALWGAGIGLYLLPLIARPLLYAAMVGMREYNLTLPAVALGTIGLLLAGPLVLLGTLSPLAVRLLTSNEAHSGEVAGRVLALSTLASLAGAFTPVFVWLPWLGTRRTFALLGLLALGMAIIVALHLRHRRLLILAGSTLVVGLLSLSLWTGGPIKGVDPDGRARVLYEQASAYNFIQVLEWRDERWLRLNEGEGLHSVWRPGPGLSEGIWDYFLLAPLFRPADHADIRPQKVLIIGLAGGTAATLYYRAFGPVPMVGVELDPEVLKVGYTYFYLGAIPTLRTVAGDGRVYLTLTEETFDVVLVDAYRPPYIPFHLVTVEFFDLVRQRLREDGVVAVNVVRTATDRELVNAVAHTMQQVFPTVYIIDEPLRGAPAGNSLVVGVRQPVPLTTFWENVARSNNPYLHEMARRARGYIFVPPKEGIIFRDDRAPVEYVVHRLIVTYLLDF